ncbi:sigma-54-dependent Fis family transcriptional regulator [Beijerinckia sp. L45]|uniref:sigma-54-dependent Fis family transcriptional regulator n=1 Tax=Beijerinckia sp. L45 TaxID=1641855 RepID=UPI00131AB4FD|nr:sigma-54-dependent Fis family transcriptional regulator [Beijerinckia sp. L45]
MVALQSISHSTGRAVLDEAEAIAASWRRCLDQYGMDPERDDAIQIVTRRELRDALNPLDHLVSIAHRELDELHGLVASSGYAVILTDTAGIALTCHADGDLGFKKWGLSPGAVWSEACEGTNGVGLCLAEQRAFTVHRQEHFKSRYRVMTCNAVPIFDAFGDLAGALDVSSCSLDIDRRLAAFARAATERTASAIEDASFRYAYRRNWIVSLDPSGTSGALCAFDDSRRLVGANRKARAALGVDNTLIATGIEVHETEFRDFPLALQGSLFVDGSRAVLQVARSAPFSPPIERPARRLPLEPARAPDLAYLVGSEPTLREAIRRIGATASLDLPLLISGETGTGKKTFAEAVHNSLVGEEHPFVTVACATLSEVAFDETMFGIAGAGHASVRGLVDLAAGGTLFLDEVGDIPLHLQARFLDVIELRQIKPSGSHTPVTIAMRIICTTQRNLPAMVAAGSFRADLYQRLCGLAVHLPPIRERQDRPALIEAMMVSIDPLAHLSAEAVTALDAYSWPGNLRELDRTLKIVRALAGDRRIGAEDIKVSLPSKAPGSETRTELHALLGSTEREVIVDKLQANGADVAKAARALGVSRATLYRRMRRFDIKTT